MPENQVDENHLETNYTSEVIETPRQKIRIPGFDDGAISDLQDVGGEGEMSSADTTYDEARKLVIRYQKASASFLQQMMGIGYPKAAKVIMRLEENGVIGPANGSKPRDVYETLDDI